MRLLPGAALGWRCGGEAEGCEAGGTLPPHRLGAGKESGGQWQAALILFFS